MSLIAALLPDGVATSEAYQHPAELRLFPEEEATLTGAVDKRRREFSAVRRCARHALTQLGFPARPILPGTRGAPRWPQGVVGSMTHCAGYCAAAVARSGEMRAVGIDAEPNESLPEGVLATIALPDETQWVADLLATRPAVRWDRLLFSAKESVFKTWFPMTGEWLGFEQAIVSVDPDAGTFASRLLVPGLVPGWEPPGQYHGRWIAAQGLLLTAIALPKPRAA